MADAGRPLVYGGGAAGIMGAVSGAVLEAGGDVTGVVPYAMVAVGGEIDAVKSTKAAHVMLKEEGIRAKVRVRDPCLRLRSRSCYDPHL